MLSRSLRTAALVAIAFVPVLAGIACSSNGSAPPATDGGVVPPGADGSTSMLDAGDGPILLPDGAWVGPDGAPVPPPDASTPPAASLWASDVVPAFDAATVQHVLAVHAAGIAKGNRDDVFMKLGDSITSSPSFLLDIGNGSYALGNYTALGPTIKAFLAVQFDDNTNPFTRDPDAVQSGLTTRDVVANLGWITTETNKTHPAWAIMMFGTDDLEIMEADEFRANYDKVLDLIEAQGTIAVISTMPWRAEVQRAEELVPVFNSIVRDIAAKRHLPYIDLVKGLDPLANRGLSNDSVHPSVELSGDAGATNSGDFTSVGLAYGYNVRNLTTIQMFDRLRAVVGDEPTPVVSVPPLGDGGPSPITCDAVHDQGCPNGKTCMLVNDVTVCRAPGASGAGGTCTNDPSAPVICAAKNVCIDPGFCFQLCAQDSDCTGPSVGPVDNRPHCVTSLNGGSFLLCNIPCNPVTAAGPSGCGAGLACRYAPAAAPDPQLTGCATGGNGTEGQVCDGSTICGPGLDCLPIGAPSGICREICRIGNNADCSVAGETCAPPAGQAGPWYGFCCPGGKC